jgi:hypothetical protein
MKKHILFLTFLSLYGCKSKDSFYSGYIYDFNKNPLANVKVCELDSVKNYTITNSKGFFYLKRNKNWISDLILKYNNKLDTIRTVGKQGGEKVNYFFIDNNKDTLFIEISKIK